MEAPLHHFLRIQNCLDQTRKKPSHPAVSSHRRGQWGLEGTGGGWHRHRDPGVLSC